MVSPRFPASPGSLSSYTRRDRSLPASGSPAPFRGRDPGRRIAPPLGLGRQVRRTNPRRWTDAPRNRAQHGAKKTRAGAERTQLRAPECAQMCRNVPSDHDGTFCRTNPRRPGGAGNTGVSGSASRAKVARVSHTLNVPSRAPTPCDAPRRRMPRLPAACSPAALLPRQRCPTSSAPASAIGRRRRHRGRAPNPGQ